MDLASLPAPPPWNKVVVDGEESVRYVNEVTGETIDEHPLVRLQRKKEESEKETGVIDTTSTDKLNVVNRISLLSILYLCIFSLYCTFSFTSYLNPIQGTSGMSNTATSYPIPEIADEEDVIDENGLYSDFNCKWKENSMGPKDRYYTLTLRYFHDSGRVGIKFSGISGQWKYSILEGNYGPITRYDLFIGSQIKLFGRHLTVSTTTANVCHWLDDEAKFLEKQRLWLQEKISSCGMVPVVKKEPPVQLRHVDRISSTTGTKNLRKIHIQICKLREQLCDIGMDHFASMMPSRKPSKSHK